MSSEHQPPDVEQWNRELGGPVPRADTAAADAEADFTVLGTFQRFDQKNDVFCRSFWDPKVRSSKSDVFYETYRRPLKHFRKVDGFSQRDYSVRNAAWHLPDIFAELKEDQDRREGFLDEYTVLRDGSPEQRSIESAEEMSREIKHIATTFGADLVGITEYDHRWVYQRKYSRAREASKPSELPTDLPNVIVTGTAMDYNLVKTVPSALSGTATGLGYAQDVVTVLSLAQYIRNLGYRAIPSLNDTALAIPLAIKAGLGEYGRHGLLITKDFGPRVRLGKVFTDLPLAHDRPARFGVKAFCDICRRCSQSCPPKAIPSGEPSDAVHNVSNLQGVKKWSVDGEKCFGFWAGQNSDCSICIRVCPYNKDYSKRRYRVGRWLAGTALRKFMLKLDVRLGYGVRRTSKWWWARGKAQMSSGN